MTGISPAALERRLAAGEPVTLLDTRDRDEIDEWRIEAPGADHRHLPYAKVLSASVAGDPADLVDADVRDADEVVVVCARGEASDEVAGILRDAGLAAVNLEGGMEEWARLYEAVEVELGGVTLVQYRRPASGCLAYALVSAGEALVVDPLRAFADRYEADLAERGAEVVAVIDTHVHADHVSGLRSVAESTGATPLMSETAVERGVTFDVETAAAGDELAVGNATVEVVAAPGHTSGLVALFTGDALLTGDSLFLQAVPRPDLERAAHWAADRASGRSPGAEDDEGAAAMARELHRTLTDRFARFDDDVLVAPGHHAPAERPREDGAYVAPLGEVRGRLDAFSQSKEEFAAAVLDRLPPRPANVETIVDVNLGRASVDGDDAFELELGPNNCAASAD